MAKIPLLTVEQIKSRADILDIVSEFVQLKRRGKNYFGLCPFHEEKTPSFSVNPSMGIFHCFGCGKGGNAISFIMEYEKIGYVEALKRLADRYGIEIEWEEGDASRRGEVELLYELHDIANNFYNRQLSSEKGAEALKYLIGRGFNKSILNQFSIGFAADEWEGLFKQLDINRFTPNILEKSGLFIRKDGNNFYDRFRNRIIFPIKNISGRVIAFGGRTMNPDEDAKYINSPETPIYFKSGIFYGLSASKEAIRKSNEAILVEGYTDFLRFYSSGITNVIAASGTALTYHHAHILKRFASKVSLCYDGDEAGKKATERAGFVLLREGLDVRAIVLPEGEDPDSFLKNSDISAFKKIYDGALEFIPFYIDLHKDSMTTPASKTLFVEQTVEELAQIRNPVTRDFFIKEVAEHLGLKEDIIYSQIRYFFRKKGTQKRTLPRSEEQVKYKIQLNTAPEKAEYELLKVFLCQQKDLQKIIINNIKKKNFKHPVLSKLAKKIIDMIKSGEEFVPSDIFNYELSEKEKLYLSRLILESEPPQTETDLKDLYNLATDCMIVLLTVEVDKDIRELREKIKEAEKKGKETVDFVIELSKKQNRRLEIGKRLREIEIGK